MLCLHYQLEVYILHITTGQGTVKRKILSLCTRINWKFILPDIMKNTLMIWHWALEFHSKAHALCKTPVSQFYMPGVLEEMGSWKGKPVEKKRILCLLHVNMMRFFNTGKNTGQMLQVLNWAKLLVQSRTLLIRNHRFWLSVIDARQIWRTV